MVNGDSGLAVRAELFGTVFVLVQNLSRRVDLALEPLGLTSRQWLLLAVLQRHFPGRAPSLTEAAAAYGSSRQNVKRIAEQLARRGYLRLVSDPADRRPTRLELTERMAVFEGTQLGRRQAGFLRDSMAGLDDAQLEQLRDLALAWLAALSTQQPAAADPRSDGSADDEADAGRRAPYPRAAASTPAISTPGTSARAAGRAPSVSW